MHTSTTMKTPEFDYSSNGAPITFDDVLPDFRTNDRVGILTHTPGGSFAAAPLLLAAIGRFYELLIATGEDFYAYPDFYVFHVDRLRGHHGKIDVWPQHKEVVVDADPESILEAINDRGITRLLLEAAPPAGATLLRETVTAAESRLRDVFTFVSGDQAAGGLHVTASSAAQAFIIDAIEVSRGVIDDATAERCIGAASAPQRLQRITTTEAVRVICGLGEASPALGFSADYISRHGLDETVMAQHRLKIGGSP